MFKLHLSLTSSSTRLMFESGGAAWRLRFFWRTVHGNRSAMLANVSPHKEKSSLVRQVWTAGELRPVVFPSGIQPSPFVPCGNVQDFILLICHTALHIFHVACVLLPDCCINPWSFFSFFYSCIECFLQSVANSLHNCLFHPPPCLQHSDGHLSHLLQDKERHWEKTEVVHWKFDRNSVPALRPERLRASLKQTCFVVVAYSFRAGDIRTFPWRCVTALYTGGITVVTTSAVGRQSWKTHRKNWIFQLWLWLFM